MKAFGFYLAQAFIGIMGFLPKQILYAISNLLYYILYYIVHYRRALVYKNLRDSFPEKSKNEIDIIAKKFYRHLADVFIEYIILSHANSAKIKQIVSFSNPEVVDNLLAKNKSVLIVTAHYCNWELACCIGNVFKNDDETIAVYKRLHNKYWDKWFNKIRSKFSVKLVEMRQIYLHLARNKRNNVKSATVLIADQLPKIDETKYSVNFLNHAGTIIFLGPETLAKKLDLAVVFGDMNKISRGKYSVQFVPFVENAESTSEHEITDMYIRYLEEKIRRTPEFWMWSHNRWKRTHKTESAK